ncbi:MAG: hypothetical protein IPM63_09330 [Acidobacteriota bacterium]|nr:MAG: hypothetical protein IPM63_09330 [Acidobacteriota bacterium]
MDSSETTATLETPSGKPSRSTRRWKQALCVFSITGVVTGLVGLLVNMLAFFGDVRDRGTYFRAGTLLILIALPVVFLGAYARRRLEKSIRTK